MSNNVVSLVILVYKDIYLKEMFIIYITKVYIYSMPSYFMELGELFIARDSNPRPQCWSSRSPSPTHLAVVRNLWGHQT